MVLCKGSIQGQLRHPARPAEEPVVCGAAVQVVLPVSGLRAPGGGVRRAVNAVKLWEVQGGFLFRQKVLYQRVVKHLARGRIDGIAEMDGARPDGFVFRVLKGVFPREYLSRGISP